METTAAPAPDYAPAPLPNERRNFVLGVANGGIYQGGETFVDSNTVLPVLLSTLTHSNALIGLGCAMGDIGWLLPQVFVAPWASRLPRQLPLYQRASIVRGSCLFAVALAAWAMRGHPGWLLAAFFTLNGIYSVAGGFGAVAFMEIVGRTVRSERLGAFFAQRLFWGGTLGAVAGLFARQVLRMEDPGTQLAILFGLAAIICSSAYMMFGSIREPESPAHPTAPNPLALLRQGVRWFHGESVFRRLFWARVTLSIWLASSPFITLFAVNQLGGGGRAAGTLLVGRLAGYVLSTLLWQRLSKRSGNRTILRIAASLGCGLLLVSAGLSWASPWGMGWIPARLALLGLEAVATLGGAVSSGLIVGYAAAMIENAPLGQRQSFVSLMNTFVGPTMLLPMLGGFVVDAFNAPLLFLLCGIASIAGLRAVSRLPDRAARALAT